MQPTGGRDSQPFDINNQKIHPQPMEDSTNQNSEAVESMISKIFTNISLLKSAYIQLQAAHTPYDPDKIQAADKLVIAKLKDLSELKHFYRENNPKLLCVSPQDSRFMDSAPLKPCVRPWGGGRSRGRSSNMRGSSWGRGGGRRGYSGGGADSPDKIDSLGRLMTWILRHTASKLNLEIRSDGYAKVQDLLKLNLYTLADIPLNSHTIDDVREAVMADKKQRFSLVEENGEFYIRANQGHTLKAVKTESLLKPIASAEEVPVCVHGTYRENLQSILEHGLKRMKRLHIHFACGLPKDNDVISGMRHNVNILIFLDVKKALEEGMKLYFSENKVILTEGFNGVVPLKYFEKIESRPGGQLLYIRKDKDLVTDLVTGMQDLTIEKGARREGTKRG